MLGSKRLASSLNVLVVFTCVFFAGCDEDPADPPAQIAAVKGKRWQLQSLTVHGKKSKPAQGIGATLIFDGSRFTGSGGCNSYEVQFTATPQGAMNPIQISWTEMGCLAPGATQLEQNLAQVFSNLSGYTLTAKKLVLSSKIANTQAVFIPFVEPVAAPLTGTTWRLKHFEESGGEGPAATVSAASVVGEMEITLTIENGKATGMAGCNTFTTDVNVAGDSITFSNFVVTGKNCGEAVVQQEERFLTQLKQSRKFTIRGNRLSISGENNRNSLRFQVKPQ